jgi:hypothetical protein
MTMRALALLLAVAGVTIAACDEGQPAQPADGAGISAGPGADSPPAGGGNGTTMLATAFPLGSVIRAAEVSLPEDVAIGQIPGDIRWMPGNQVTIPVVRGSQQAELVVTVLPEREECTASSTVLSGEEESAIGAEVCAVWEAEGRLPVVVPDPDAPLPVDPSDAAR